MPFILLLPIGIFLLLGVLFLKLSLSKKKRINYRDCKTAEAIVCHTEDFFGDRWTVEFVDENGLPQMAMDDTLAGSTFSSDKYLIPKTKQPLAVYYWERNDMDRGKFSVNGQEVRYYFHFCDERYYELAQKREKHSKITLFCVGIVFVTVAILLAIQMIF